MIKTNRHQQLAKIVLLWYSVDNKPICEVVVAMNTLDRDIESSTASALSTPSKPTPGGLFGHSYLLGLYLRRWLRYVASDSQIPRKNQAGFKTKSS